MTYKIKKSDQRDNEEFGMAVFGWDGELLAYGKYKNKAEAMKDWRNFDKPREQTAFAVMSDGTRLDKKGAKDIREKENEEDEI